MINHELAKKERDVFEAQIANDSYIPSVIDGIYTSDYRVWIKFDDGSSGEVDLSDLTNSSGKFAQLADINYFAKVFYDKEMHTIAWDNGLDLAPESLYMRLKRKK